MVMGSATTRAGATTTGAAVIGRAGAWAVFTRRRAISLPPIPPAPRATIMIQTRTCKRRNDRLRKGVATLAASSSGGRANRLFRPAVLAADIGRGIEPAPGANVTAPTGERRSAPVESRGL